MSKIMYKDKQIMGCISDAQYVAFNNTDTGLSATNVQNAITEVNGKLIDQSNGKSYILHTGYKNCKGFAENRLDFTVDFPFLAKDTNYNVTINTVYFDGFGLIDVSKCHITAKYTNCVSINVRDIINSYETSRILVDASITIIF